MPTTYATENAAQVLKNAWTEQALLDSNDTIIVNIDNSDPRLTTETVGNVLKFTLTLPGTDVTTPVTVSKSRIYNGINVVDELLLADTERGEFTIRETDDEIIVVHRIEVN
jgi:hypothetical protein